MNKFNRCYTKVIENRKLNFKDVVIVPRKSTINEVNLRVQYDFQNNIITQKKSWTGVPIFVHGGIESVSKEQEYITMLPRSVNNNILIPNDYFMNTDKYSLSCGLNDYHLALELIRKIKNDSGINVKFLCINIPNRYINEMQDITLMIKNYHPDIVIIAGNVLTPDITYDLIKYSGVDIVKCGLINEIKEYPLFSAVLECSLAAHEAGGLLLFKESNMNNNNNTNNVPKAFMAGSDFVEIENNNITQIIKILKESLKNSNSETLDDFFFNSRFLKLI
jgi:GMP reductase